MIYFETLSNQLRSRTSCNLSPMLFCINLEYTTTLLGNGIKIEENKHEAYQKCNHSYKHSAIVTSFGNVNKGN